MFLTALLVLGTKESARFNLIITVAHLVLVVFIIIAGAWVYLCFCFCCTRREDSCFSLKFQICVVVVVFADCMLLV